MWKGTRRKLNTLDAPIEIGAVGHEATILAYDILKLIQS